MQASAHSAANGALDTIYPMATVQRARRSCLAVPGSSAKMLEKAQGLPADQVFLDLEDSVAPLAKEEAREEVRREVIDAPRRLVAILRDLAVLEHLAGVVDEHIDVIIRSQ